MSGKTFAWSSSNSSVASVDGSGVVTGVVGGSATISARVDGIEGAGTITVSSPLNVVLIPTQDAIAGTVSANGGFGKVLCVVNWTAAISGTGTAVWNDLTWTQQSYLGPLSKTEAATPFGASSAAFSAGNQKLQGTWSSVYGVNGVPQYIPFTVTVTMTYTDQATLARKSTAPIVVSCNAGTGSLTISPTTASINVGAAQQLTATVRDVTGTILPEQLVSWSSSGGAASVDQSGKVRGLAIGTSIVTATSGGRVATATITVAAQRAVTISVAPTPVILYVGNDVQLKATATDAGGSLFTPSVTWASSNTAVATVDQTGHVVSKTAGSATISATADGVTGKADISVLVPNVTTIRVSPSTASIAVNGNQQFSALLLDPAGNTVTGPTVIWSTSAGSVATVDQSGYVTGVAAGTASVIATLLSNPAIRGSATATVTAPASGDAVYLGTYTLTAINDLASVSTSWVPLPKTYEGDAGISWCFGAPGFPTGYGSSNGSSWTYEGGTMILLSDHTGTLTLKESAMYLGRKYDVSASFRGIWEVQVYASGPKIAWIGKYSASDCGGARQFGLGGNGLRADVSESLYPKAAGVLESYSYRWQK